jgi:acetylornithine deacetylase/succinyl-diaminopimelate desuccinylase family protein
MRVPEADLVDLIRELVNVPSENPPGKEGEVAAVLHERLETSSVEFAVKSVDVRPCRPNVVARAGDPSDGSLLLTGHTDVVPADSASWRGHPYQLKQRDGRLVGRGTADMKGALAAKLVATEQYLRGGGPGEVVLAFVIGEEAGGIGTKALIERGIDVDAAVVGEPTDLDVCIAEKGVARYRISTSGRSAHSGRPDEGLNAIEGMRLVLDAVADLDEAVRRKTTRLLAPETVTVTEIEGGSAPNVVADEAIVTVDWRFHPDAGNDPTAFDERVREAVADALDGQPWNANVTRLSFGRTSETPADDLFVGTVERAVADIRGSATLAGLDAITDARYFRLDADIPTVVCGPASIAYDAHTVNESVAETDLIDAAKIYRRTLERFFEADSDVPADAE